MNLIILAAVFVLRAVWLYFALSVNKPWVYAVLAIVSVAAVFAVCWLSFVVITRGESPLNEPINRRKAIIMSVFASGIAFIHNLFWFIFIAKALAANNGHAFIAVLFIIIVNFLLEAALTLISAYLHLLAANPKTETEKI